MTLYYYILSMLTNRFDLGESGFKGLKKGGLPTKIVREKSWKHGPGSPLMVALCSDYLKNSNLAGCNWWPGVEKLLVTIDTVWKKSKRYLRSWSAWVMGQTWNRLIQCVAR